MSLKKKSSMKKMTTKDGSTANLPPVVDELVIPVPIPSRKNSNAGSSEGSRRSSLNPGSRNRSRSNSDVDIFSGTYAFEKYDEHLEEYLDSLGLPGQDLGPVVRQTNVKIMVKKPKWPDTKWSLTTYEIGNFDVFYCISSNLSEFHLSQLYSTVFNLTRMHSTVFHFIQLFPYSFHLSLLHTTVFASIHLYLMSHSIICP